MINIISQTQSGPNSYTIKYESNLETPTFYIWVNGEFLTTTFNTEYTFSVSYGQEIHIEIFDNSDDRPEMYYASNIHIQWEHVDRAKKYIIKKYNHNTDIFDSIHTRPDMGVGNLNTYISPRLDDSITHIYQVVPVDTADQEGDSLDYTFVMARRPDNINWELGVEWDSMTSSNKIKITIDGNDYLTTDTVENNNLYYVTVRKRNKYGLWNLNTNEKMINILDDASIGYIPPTPPSLLNATMAADGKIKLSGTYYPAVDSTWRGYTWIIRTKENETPTEDDPIDCAYFMRSNVGIETLRTTNNIAYTDGAEVYCNIRVAAFYEKLIEGVSVKTITNEEYLSATHTEGIQSIVVSEDSDVTFEDWDDTGYCAIYSPLMQYKPKEIVYYEKFDEFTLNVDVTGRAQWGSTFQDGSDLDIIQPIVKVESTNTDGILVTTYTHGPQKPAGKLFLGTSFEQHNIDNITVESIEDYVFNVSPNIKVVSSPNKSTLWCDDEIIWRYIHTPTTQMLFINNDYGFKQEIRTPSTSTHESIWIEDWDEDNKKFWFQRPNYSIFGVDVMNKKLISERFLLYSNISLTLFNPMGPVWIQANSIIFSVRDVITQKWIPYLAIQKFGSNSCEFRTDKGVSQQYSQAELLDLYGD